MNRITGIAKKIWTFCWWGWTALIIAILVGFFANVLFGKPEDFFSTTFIAIINWIFGPAFYQHLVVVAFGLFIIVSVASGFIVFVDFITTKEKELASSQDIKDLGRALQPFDQQTGIAPNALQSIDQHTRVIPQALRAIFQQTAAASQALQQQTVEMPQILQQQTGAISKALQQQTAAIEKALRAIFQQTGATEKALQQQTVEMPQALQQQTATIEKALQQQTATIEKALQQQTATIEKALQSIAQQTAVMSQDLKKVADTSLRSERQHSNGESDARQSTENLYQ
jgi:septal ring factor EnvC (AmiA/AmiB activator)